MHFAAKHVLSKATYMSKFSYSTQIFLLDNESHTHTHTELFIGNNHI